MHVYTENKDCCCRLIVTVDVAGELRCTKRVQIAAFVMQRAQKIVVRKTAAFGPSTSERLESTHRIQTSADPNQKDFTGTSLIDLGIP